MQPKRDVDATTHAGSESQGDATIEAAAERGLHNASEPKGDENAKDNVEFQAAEEIERAEKAKDLE